MLLSFFVGRKRREEAVLSYTIRDADAPTTHAYTHVNAMPCYHPSGDPKTARAVSDTAPRTERRGDRRNAPPLMISRSPVWHFCPPDDYLPVVLAVPGQKFPSPQPAYFSHPLPPLLFAQPSRSWPMFAIHHLQLYPTLSSLPHILPPIPVLSCLSIRPFTPH